MVVGDHVSAHIVISSKVSQFVCWVLSVGWHKAAQNVFSMSFSIALCINLSSCHNMFQFFSSNDVEKKYDVENHNQVHPRLARATMFLHTFQCPTEYRTHALPCHDKELSGISFRCLSLYLFPYIISSCHKLLTLLSSHYIVTLCCDVCRFSVSKPLAKHLNC